MHRAKEVLKGSWSFWIKLPHTERLPLTWQGPADSHYLNDVHKTDALLGKASDATLQSLHFIDGSPVQSLIDP